MVNCGGGAEAQARRRQYEYGINSNLILTADSRSREIDKPTGEVQSLRGRIDPKSFGDRATVAAEKKKKKERDNVVIHARPAKKRRFLEESVLTTCTEEVDVYIPKTKESRAAYECMLSVIQRQLGGQPLSIVSSAAYEILVVLKNDELNSFDKRIEIEKLLNAIANCVFDQLVGWSKCITDFCVVSDDAGVIMDDGDDGVGIIEALGALPADKERYLDVDEEEDEEEDEENDDLVMQIGGGIGVDDGLDEKLNLF